MSVRKLCWLTSRSPCPHPSGMSFIEWDITPFEWFDLDLLQLLSVEGGKTLSSLSTVGRALQPPSDGVDSQQLGCPGRPDQV